MIISTPTPHYFAFFVFSCFRSAISHFALYVLFSVLPSAVSCLVCFASFWFFVSFRLFRGFYSCSFLFVCRCCFFFCVCQGRRAQQQRDVGPRLPPDVAAKDAQRRGEGGLPATADEHNLLPSHSFPNQPDLQVTPTLYFASFSASTMISFFSLNNHM